MKPTTKEQVFFNDYYSKGEDAWEVFSNDIRKEKFYERAKLINKLVSKLHLDKQAVIVDIGCGDGLFDKHLDFTISIGFDVSPLAIKKARKLKNIKKAVVANAIDLPIKASSVDLVLLIETIYYHDSRKIMQEVYRVLKPGGYIILCTGNALDINRIVRKPFSLSNHEFIYTATGKRWQEKRLSLFAVKRLFKANAIKLLTYAGVLLYVPFLTPRSKLLRKFLFPLGKVLKLFSNQIIILGQKCSK